MASINVNSEVTDQFYRYKMPKIIAKVSAVKYDEWIPSYFLDGLVSNALQMFDSLPAKCF